MYVIVLCPNAKRVTVEVTPNSSILQILEEACKKQKINPDDFDLHRNNKVLDLTLPFRFANIPNNAVLDLKPSAGARKESTVTVALQLESGERVVGEFKSGSTIQDVLEHCLKSTSTRAEGDEEPVCIYMRQKITGDAIATTSLRSLGLTKGQAIIRLMYRKAEQLSEQAHVSTPLVAPPAPSAPLNRNNNMQKECRSRESPIFNQSAKQARLETSSRKDAAANRDSLPQDASSHGSSSMDQDEKSLIKTAASNDEEEMEYDMSVEEVTPIGDIIYVGERQAVVYDLNDISSVKKADLPEEFFELTVNDAKYLMEEYRRERVAMENQPLLTKEQRERRILQKLANYSQTVIRIYFPERLVLQAVFSAIDTVQTVCDFVRDFLEDRDLKFYLYITPPKEKLHPGKTLLEALLVPAAVVYFGCDIQLPKYLIESLRGKVSDPRAAAQAAAESRNKSFTATPVIEIPSENLENYAAESIPERKPSSSLSSTQSSAKPQNDAKLPKWLKLSRQ